MSDHFISIVPKETISTDPKMLGDEIIAWLSAKKIILNVLSDCTLGDDGYPPGENYESILKEKDPQLMELVTNGLEVITERHIFHNGGTDISDICCKKCGSSIYNKDWQEALGEWLDASDEDKIECPNCKHRCSISEYEFVPSWGFGSFGLTFWNWEEFNDDFIRELEGYLGSKVLLIYGRI